MNSFSPLMNEIYLNIWLSRNSSVGFNPMTDSDFYILPMQLLIYMLFGLFFSFFLSQEQMKAAVKEDMEKGLEEDMVMEKDQSK